MLPSRNVPTRIGALDLSYRRRSCSWRNKSNAEKSSQKRINLNAKFLLMVSGDYTLRPVFGTVRHYFFQLGRFGMVGACATVIHSSAYLYFVTGKLLPPILANLAAYAIAFSVSFLGHCYWTFGDAEKGGRNNYAIFRFLAVSLSGLAINSAAVLILVNHLKFADWTPLIVIIGVTPIFTFLLNRCWVFYTLRSVRASLSAMKSNRWS